MDTPTPKKRADTLADDLTAPEHARKYAHRDDVADDRVELTREQQDETNQAWAGPGVPIMTDGQWKGLVIGALAGGAIGAIVALPGAFIPMSDLDVGWRLLIVAIVGALMGGTIGVVYLGGRMPELEGETADASGRPDLGSSARDPGTDDRGRHKG